MKKNKKLRFNKQVISNFQTNILKGGGNTAGNCTSRIDIDNCASNAGCLGGTDETLSCCGYSCSCPTFGPIDVGG
ncbi:hypothetical protein ACJD0Z_18395 [Flavobacteriaceae bacterium M23B6Z8]